MTEYPRRQTEEALTLFGASHVLDLLAHTPQCVQEIWVDTEEAEVGRRAEAMVHGLRVRAASRDDLRRIGGPDARQIVAVLKPLEYLELSALLPRLKAHSTLLALDGVTDPGNLGAILRNAAFFGVDGVLLRRNGGALVNSVVLKRSAGAAARIPLVLVTNLNRALVSLREAGFWSYATLPGGGREPHEEAFPARTCLVLGDEGRGLRPNVAAHCDLSLRLPGGFESLNVASFSAVVLYERYRQERSSGMAPKNP